LHIPYQFIKPRVRLSWRDIRFGLANDLLAPEAPVEFAIDQAERFQGPPAVQRDLAGAGNDAQVLDLVERLAESESRCPDDEIRRKWLYLALAWVYEHRNRYSDPLQEVEKIYADFDYPERVSSFVRYMPMVGPDLGSREANERRLLDRWKEYLDSVGGRFSPS